MKQYERVSLGELLSLERRPVAVMPEEQYPEIGLYCFGRGIFHKAPRSGAEVGNKDLYLIKEGDFILQITFAWEGAVALASKKEEGMYGSVRFPAFRIDESRCYPPYLLNYFRTKAGVEQLGRISPGSADRNRVLSLKRIPEVVVPLPTLEEQRRIVARIEELAAKIEEARGLRREGQKQVSSIVRLCLMQTFESQTGKSGWEKRPIFEAAEVARGKFAHRPRNEPRFYGGDIPFIQIGDISNSNRHIQHHSQTLNKDGLSISRLFPKGTVVIAITGATIGVTGILNFDACFPDSIVGLTARQDVATSEFIYWALEYAKSAALAEATQTTQPNINLGNLVKLRIPIPPLEEQRRIVAYLDSLQAKVDALKRLQAETADELDALLPSVLDRAFRGKL